MLRLHQSTASMPCNAMLSLFKASTEQQLQMSQLHMLIRTPHTGAPTTKFACLTATPVVRQLQEAHSSLPFLFVWVVLTRSNTCSYLHCNDAVSPILLLLTCCLICKHCPSAQVRLLLLAGLASEHSAAPRALQAPPSQSLVDALVI